MHASVRTVQLQVIDNAMNGQFITSGIADLNCYTNYALSCTDATKPTKYPKYVEAVNIYIPSQIYIVFTGMPEIAGKTLILIPKTVDQYNVSSFLAPDASALPAIPTGRISWTCHSADIAGRASGGRGILPGKYAPPWCTEVPLE